MKNKILSLFILLISTSVLSSCGYNSLQGMDEDVKASWAEVQNQYQRRYDLIPNLVETVKGYAKHEKDTLEAVVKARAEATQTKLEFNSLSDAKAFQKFEQSQSGLTQALGKLMVVAEQYPDLKANSNFRDLQSQLEGTENRIAVARKRYIEVVAEFNKGVRFFPTNMTAKYILHMEPKESFTVTTQEAKDAPKIKF